MTEFHERDDVRAEPHDGDDAGQIAERLRAEARVGAVRLVEERKRLGLTQRDVADPTGVTLGQVVRLENGDLDVNDVTPVTRRSRALSARPRPFVDHGTELRQIA